MKINLFIFSVLLSSSIFSQITNYNDVVVIVNDNSQTSLNIGNYFQQARNIPNANIIHIQAPTSESIDSLQFEQIRAQIESQLLVNQLADSINYIVTTKGVPLKITNDCGISSNVSCASFDSELMLILGTFAAYIGGSSSYTNPYYDATQHFSSADVGLYLVTRLDGYTQQDIYDLIDRSGPEIILNVPSSNVVVDLNAAAAPDSAYFMDFYLQPTYDFFANNSWNVQLDGNTTPLLNQNDVAAYIYEGSGGAGTNVALNYSWTEGSIASISTSRSAFSFDPTANPSNYFVLGGLIAEGCTGAYGHVDAIYYSQLANSEILVNRYFNPLDNFNLAESFYMAEQRISWQGVAIGDPKSKVKLDNKVGLTPESDFEINLYPNPTNGLLQLTGTEMIESVSVYDLRGSEVKRVDHLNSNSTQIDLGELNEGVYIVQLEIGGTMHQKRVVLKR